MFVLYLKTFLLSVVTLGIYSFWGRTEIRRYLHNATMAGEDRFAWHGTPMELLKGWGKAVGLILSFYFVVVLLSALDPERGGPIGTVFLYVAVVAVAPWAIVASQRYRLSRTSLRGIHFHSTADAGEFAKLYFKGLLLTIITLSLYSPWFFNDLQSYLRRNSYYGDRPFSYDGKGGDLFRSYLIFIVLLIPSLYLISFWFFAK